MKRKPQSDLAFPPLDKLLHLLASVTSCKMTAFASVLAVLGILFFMAETFAQHRDLAELLPHEEGKTVPGSISGEAPSDDAWSSSATASTAEDSSPSTNVASPMPERIRRASELLLEGDAARARDLVSEALRECESVHASRDCAAWSQALRGLKSIMGKASERVAVTNSIGMKLVRIPAGEYMMGSPKQEMDWLRLTFKKIWREGHKQWFQDEMPLHPVRITKPFYMGATAITVGQFRQFIKETSYKTDAEKGDGGMIYSKKEERWVPRKGMKWDNVPWSIADNQPVVFVSWNDAQAFTRWLSRKEKRTYRLPSEAEWEMACRGGSAWVRFPWGDRLPGDKDMNFGDGNAKLPESLTTVNDGYEHVAPVGSYPPNGFGLYDMDGNVMQWVEDRYDRNYYESSPIDDPKGPSTGSSRVNKGGNWYSSPADCRCAFRGFSGTNMSFFNMGFRVLLEEEKDPGAITTAKKSEDSTIEQRVDNALPPSEEDGLRLFREAMFAAQQQQWDQATQELEEALKLYEKREDHKWIPRVKATLGGIYAERNRKYKSKELYTQALSEFRKIGDTNSARIILARLQDLETSPGVKVAEIKKGGMADRVGMVTGDIIIEYAGETGFRVIGFKKFIEDYSRADQVTISVMNSNNEITTAVVRGGPLGVAVEDIKRPPRPATRPQDEERGRDRQRPRPRRDRR
ncbi:MAG: SUMF1/EgtB/PvdO family nonheme iron enzyme [Desulfomonile tiedjei]|uniref:SUMF1/EgtB/PvdO family nonheme iron enzyme n=1 Tax=Desulfomonile tiedjei TaxID=2358 RepID=A0A9D6V465_9BACT|nr:SUMF1/EgtB/PvdO family nonheme iron enzyme [Desulfomonile tiedjei]